MDELAKAKLIRLIADQISIIWTGESTLKDEIEISLLETGMVSLTSTKLTVDDLKCLLQAVRAFDQVIFEDLNNSALKVSFLEE